MRRLAYLLTPPWAAWLQRLLFVVLYSLIVATGVRCLVLPDAALAAPGAAMAVGAGLALVGALSRVYNIEAAGLYISSAALVAGAGWALGEGAYLTAWTVLGVVAALGLRLLPLELTARSARAEHHARAAVE